MARRNSVDRVAQSVTYLLVAVALLPLALVLIYTVLNGLPAVTDPAFFLNSERPLGVPGGGIAHALVGTVFLVGMASLLAIPLGTLAGIYLVEYGRNPVGDVVRLASDVMVGAPSIAVGLFAYSLLVAPFHHFSAVSGSVALAVLMLPVVIRTTEAAVDLVPSTLREAGVALGLPRWRVSLQLVLRAALPGVTTGALLAVARAGGETAPLLFTGFGNPLFSIDPTGPMAALPLVVFHYALTPYKQLQSQAWGAALVLVVLVMLVNLGTRAALRRQAPVVQGATGVRVRKHSAIP
jgi:phosphate transport system permease protein